MPSYHPPRAFLLLPDPLLAGTGAKVIASYSEADGLYPSIAAPDTDNQGAMAVSQHGTPLEKTAVDYYVVASGGVWNEATWAWKLDSEPEPGRKEIGYRGENDQRYHWADHDPHDLDEQREYDVAYNPITATEFVYCNDISNTKVAHRKVARNQHQYCAGTGPAAAQWTVENCINADTGLTLQRNLSGSSVLGVDTLRDGTMVMLRNSSDGKDFDLYLSDDGINWTQRVDMVLARFAKYGTAGVGGFIGGFDFRRSGDYLSVTFGWLDMLNVSGLGVSSCFPRTLVSGDRGASWREVTALTSDFQCHRDPIVDGPLFAMGPVDDDAGTFIMQWCANGNTSIVKTAIRSATGNWTVYPALQRSIGASNRITSFAIQRGPQYAYLIRVYTNASSSLVSAATLVDPRNPYESSGWKDVYDLYKGLGAVAFYPHRWRCCNIGGNYLSVYARRMIGNVGAWAPSNNGYWYSRFGGWDKLPVEERDNPMMGDAPPYLHQPAREFSATGLNLYALTRIVWDAWMGEPWGGAASSGTPWTGTRTNVTTALEPDHLRLQDLTSSTKEWHASFEDTGLVYPWFGATSTILSDRASCMLEIVVKVPEAGGSLSSATVTPKVGAVIESFDVNTGSGNPYEVSVKFGNNEVAVRDSGTGAFIIGPTSVPGLQTRFHKFRYGLLSKPWASGDPVDTALWVRDEESENADWVLVGTAALTNFTPAGLSKQRVRWGHMTTTGSGVTERESHWRRVGVYGPHDGGTTRVLTDAWGIIYGGAGNDDSVLDNLRGRLVTHDRIHVIDGIQTQYSGGGGFERDRFDGSVVEAYAPGNILAIGSPRTGYRSKVPASGTTSASIVYDAGHDDSSERFHHHALAVYGFSSKTLTIEYADTASFSPVLATHTLDLGRWEGRGGTSKGNRLEVQYGASAPEIGEDASGQGALAHYLRFTAGGAPALPGKVFRIEESVYQGGTRTLRLDTKGLDLSTLSTVGSSFVVYADRGAIVYDAPVSARYMRLGTGNVQTSYDNQHRIGHFTAGITVTLDVPLDWTHSDGEQGNVTELKTRGVKRWGYIEGPSQRVIEGRMVGDITELRQRIRRYLRVTSAYDTYPLTLVTDDTRLIDPERVVLACIKSGAEFSEAGYRWTGEKWVTVGDMKMRFYEDV